MRHLLIILCIAIFMQCSHKSVTTFDATTRQIFFNADVEKVNEGLLKYCKGSKYLLLDTPRVNHTDYPPLSAATKEKSYLNSTFRFKTHPFVSFKFREGAFYITGIKSQGKELYNPPILKFIFDTKEEAELAYEELIGAYTPLSTKKRFQSSENSKTAEFTDDKSKTIREVGLLVGKGDILTNGYVLIFALGNDMDIDKKEQP